MWKLLIIFFVNGEMVERPEVFTDFEACSLFATQLVEERGEPPVGFGLACVRVPEPESHDA